jgi:uncharacterized protein (DUF433 family)
MTEHIVRDGNTGRALVASTGTPVDDILQAIEDDAQFAGLFARFPELTPAGVAAALRFARNAVGREMRYVPDPKFGVMELRERPLQPYNAGSARGGTVTLDAGEYGDVLYRLDLLEGIFDAERELDEGHGVPHEQVFASLRDKFGA